MQLWGHPDSNWGDYLVRVAYLTAIWCPRNILTHLSIIAIWSAQLILRPRILSNCKSLGYCTTYTSPFLTFTITRRCNSTTHKSMSYSVLIKIFCTENGTRTHTHLTVHQILSLRRLPIPPSRHFVVPICQRTNFVVQVGIEPTVAEVRGDLPSLFIPRLISPIHKGFFCTIIVFTY